MPLGKGRASSNALLKLLPAGFRTNPVFGDMGCGPVRSTNGQVVREGSGAREAEGGV
jgi:hypothetical protein